MMGILKCERKPVTLIDFDCRKPFLNVGDFVAVNEDIRQEFTVLMGVDLLLGMMAEVGYRRIQLGILLDMIMEELMAKYH